MPKGYLSIVLHAHLPYIRHPEHEDFLEEDWLFEAITETYIPLIKAFDALVKDNIDFRLTISISPTLMSMFMDQHLQDKYIKHINKLIELSCKEIERTKWDPAFNKLAHMYHNTFIESKRIFVDEYQKDLNRAFKRFQDLGRLEVITCCATHGSCRLWRSKGSLPSGLR